MSQGHGLLTAAGRSSGTRSDVDGGAALLSGLSAAVRRLPLPLGQSGAACQVKNANELFRDTLHMNSVAQECAELLLGTIRGSQGGVAAASASLQTVAVDSSVQQELPCGKQQKVVCYSADV